MLHLASYSCQWSVVPVGRIGFYEATHNTDVFTADRAAARYWENASTGWFSIWTIALQMKVLLNPVI